MNLKKRLVRWKTAWVFSSLLRLARIFLSKYHPLVISITGSVGKTTATDFIYQILKNKYLARKTGSNWNFKGTAYAVIGCRDVDTIRQIIWQLPKVLFHLVISDKKYPRLLVLEQGIGGRGKMDRFCQNIKSQIAVVTAIAPAHLKGFGTMEDIIREKRKIVENLSPSGVAVLNYDDERVRDMANYSPGKVVFYGLDQKADIRAEKVSVSLNGLVFDLIHQGEEKQSILIKHLSNKVEIYAVLAAVACGRLFNLAWDDIVSAVKKLKTIDGRGNILYWQDDSYIINDSYNSNPASCLAALDNLFLLGKNKHKIAVLGDMLELGDDTEKGHREVGRKAREVADQIICVGDKSRFIYNEGVKNSICQRRFYWVSDVRAATQLIKEKFQPNSLILLKGSHGVHLEKIISDLCPLKR